LFLGLDPESDLHVLHRCHNPACFRPEHLYLGTNADNVRDRIARRDSASLFRPRSSRRYGLAMARAEG
jgi:hypothetical protein